MRNLVDITVGFFSPDAGLRRFYKRAMLQRAYEGASKRDGWRPKRPGASANTDHAADAATLRARSRSLVQNVPYVAQGMRSLVANVIGTGIVPRWKGGDEKKLNDLWRLWGPHADADGRLDIYGLQAAAYRAMQVDGEVLIRKRIRRLSDGYPVPIQFQLLEIDWLDSSKNETRNGRNIINGIEYDVLGKVMGYWLFDAHPGETASLRSARRSSSFVSADNIIHLFKPERPGQGRGFPRLAPVVAWIRDLRLYQDAEQQRKNLETRLSVLATGDVSDMANPPEVGGQPDQAAAMKTGELGPLASGGITRIPQGLSLTVVKPEAAPGYVEYVVHMLHLIAAGFGVTYEMMTGDVSKVNFSSARIRMIDIRREYEMEQWTELVPMMCNPMCRAFADAAELAGLARASYDVDHAMPKWDYVNPAQDVRADLDEIAGGLSSISEKLRRRGYKPDEVFGELASDIDKLKKLGLLDVLLALQNSRSVADGNAPKPAKADA